MDRWDDFYIDYVLPVIFATGVAVWVAAPVVLIIWIISHLSWS
jgi:hypothetical protein